MSTTSGVLWRLARKFFQRARCYKLLIFVTFLVVVCANAAKTLQGSLIMPVIDELPKADFGDVLSGTVGRDTAVQKDNRFVKKLKKELKHEPEALQAKVYASFNDALQDQEQQLGPTVLARLEAQLTAEPPETRARLLAAVRRVLEKDKPIEFLKAIALLALGLSVAMFVFGCLRDYLTNYLSKRIIADIRNEVTQHMTYLPLRYYHDRRAGDLISRVTNDMAALEPATGFFFDDIIVHPIMILCALGLVLYANWMLAAAAVVFFPLYVIPLVRLGKRMRQARKKSLERMGDMTQTMVQTLGGIKVVKAFNMEATQVAEFHQHNESFFRKMMEVIRRRALGENLSQLFVGVAIALLIVGGGYLLANQYMTAGAMAIFGLGIAMINTSVRELSKSYNRLLEASAGCDRVFEILDMPRETEHDAGEELNGSPSGIEFRNVTFAYDAEPVLKDVDLKIAPGEVVALVGKSGAGKTTLCDLICRFYDPTGGEIVIGGKDLRKLRRSSLLRNLAMVTQDTFLFNASIGDNIRYGRPDADPASVEAAARAANIHDFIMSLERGYDTIVGDRGAKLSGGQRQRLAIARAVLKDPHILILDEATSALDTENEKLVQQALAQLIRSGHRRRITLIIAHRLSTIRDADRIVVLDGGRVVETGRHQDLLERNGTYASLYRTQFAN